MHTHRNVIELPLRSPHFEYVECGSKTVDARIRFDKYRGLQSGDVLKFVKRNSQKFILKKLTSMEKYDNFAHLLRTEGVRSCLPGLQDGDVKAGVELYHKFKARGESYADLAIKHKVLALRLGDVDRTPPHRPAPRTDITDLGKVLIPPSTRSRFLTMTLYVERPTQVSPPPAVITTLTTPDALIWKAADLVQSKRCRYKQTFFKYRINLDPTGQYLGEAGDDYRRLRTAVQTFRRRTTKERMIFNETEEQVGLRTQISYFPI